MALYDYIAALPVTIEAITTDRHERSTTGGFDRVSTVVSLHGLEAVGRGEDVTYRTAAHDAFGEWIGTGADGLVDRLTGAHTVGAVAETLDDAMLEPAGPWDAHTANYRRWAFESAALDLALRQADRTLESVIDRAYDPVRFVASTRLADGDDPPTLGPVKRLRAAAPGVEFKLDPTADWTPDLLRAVADTGVVRVLDFKGYYEGTDVDGDREPSMYRSIVDQFPDAILEDPAITEETGPILSDHYDRVAWDYPVTDRASLASRLDEVGGGFCNIKPSRIGSLADLFALIEFATDRDVGLYGGGQFELAVGRGQIQAIASLFYPDGPNDVAPRVYNDPTADGPLPGSPLDPPPSPSPGFGFDDMAA